MTYVRTQADRANYKNLIVTAEDGCTFDDAKTYDIVIASEVFEHVLAPIRLAANIRRRMANGSHLIVTTPNGYGPSELKNRFDPRTHLRKWNYLRRLLGKSPYVKGTGPDHCQAFTRSRLVALLAGCSFRLINFAKSDCFFAMFSTLRKSCFFGNIDVALADILPHWLVSGWYFVFELQDHSTYSPLPKRF